MKQGRSPSCMHDTPPPKRRKNDTTENGDIEPHPVHVPCMEEHETKYVTPDSPALFDSDTNVSNPVLESDEVTQRKVHSTQSDTRALEHHSSYATLPVGLIVVAPEFEILHDSWKAFEDALKAYGRATYQLYVIRSTTSVKRRNLKITESRRKEPSTEASKGERETVRIESGVSIAGDPAIGGQGTEKTLIPERFQWYSKSLKCTHGWKHRHRGTGKRGSGVVRSTSCPAKMCVTLQYRGPGPDDWKVVVTKHVRTHNHQLSKELYLYYTENRRIYDPEVLAVIGETSRAGEMTAVEMTNAHVASLMEQNTQRSGLYRILSSSHDENEQHASSMAPIAPNALTSLASFPTENVLHSGNHAIRPPDDKSKETLAAITPLRAMVLTPGTVPSKAMHGGGFCVPRVSTKVHASWDAFHDFIAQYSFDTAQVFRTRSTVSIAARNAKILSSVAAKSKQDDGESASTSSSLSSRLIPEKYKWFSKLLICTYGWKRRARDEDSRSSEHNDLTPCPAMVLARMERNVDGGWHVVINRQVQMHTHPLRGGGTSQVPIESMTDSSASAALLNANRTSSEAGEGTSSVLETEATRLDETCPRFSTHRDIVVRVPKLQSVFNSWEDFHTSLTAYSDATFQLYRTRTTSSAKGRNRKIVHVKRSGAENENDKNSESVGDPDALLDAARKIPESWRWYSKTLTCTHGWKERRRGTGKRSAHGVRSTACPVKICATVQYMNPTSRRDGVSDSVDSNCSSDSLDCWRVVVTKHIVDHNHNLSRELYQHYCENRRIYDPELLAIDTSNTVSTVQNDVSDVQGLSASTHLNHSIVSAGNPVSSQPSPLSTDQDGGLVEALTNVQLFGSSTNQHSVEGATEAFGGHQSAADMSTSPPLGQDSVPLFTSPSCYLPQGQAYHQPRPQQDNHQQQTVAAFETFKAHGEQQAGGKCAAALAAMATPGVNSSHLAMLKSAEMAMLGAFPSSPNVLSVACRVHRSSPVTNLATTSKSGDNTGTITSETDSTTATTQCACFRIAGYGAYVTIVPASDSLASAGASLNGSTELTMYTEDLDGVWQPLSHAAIQHEKLTNGSGLWRVPRIVRRYPSWEAFHKYLDVYSAATFQLYRVRTTYSVRSRNIRLRQLAASRGLVVRDTKKDDDTSVTAETAQAGGHGLSRAHLVPERYEWYSKTFLCTHGWKRRSRGNGQRVSHNVRATECPAKVCATLQRSEGTHEWNVVVTKHFTEHNHELSEALYLQYSEVRRVRDPEVLAQAEQLWRGGATRRHVFEFLKERSPNQIILMKDVHNLVQRWQTQERRSLQDQQQESETQPSPPQPQNTLSIGQDNEGVSWL